MKYSSSERLNDVIKRLRILEKNLYDMTHELIAGEISDIRIEIGSVIEED